jgi:lysophospholipase L1-like esterase
MWMDAEAAAGDGGLPMMAELAKAVWLAASVAGIGLSAFAFSSGAVRRAMFLSLIERSGGRISPRYVVVGDSLAAQCPWGRALGLRPFGVLNLAVGGATLKEIAGQIARARTIGKNFLLIDGGLNDLLFDGASLQQIEYDFKALLRRLEPEDKAVVTLMPYVSDPSFTARIDEANAIMRRLAEERGCLVVDINAEISSNGVRRMEMTNDGLHFSALADSIWIEAVRREIAAAG